MNRPTGRRKLKTDGKLSIIMCPLLGQSDSTAGWMLALHVVYQVLFLRVPQEPPGVIPEYIARNKP